MRFYSTVGLWVTLLVAAVSAETSAQHVTLKKAKAPFAEVISELRKQTGYDFVMNRQLMVAQAPLTVEMENMPLDLALKEMFAGLPLAFEIKDELKLVVVKEAGSDAIDRVSDNASVSQTPLRIRITDREGKPLDGATIIHKPSKKSTMTDKAGQATVVAQVGDELDVRFIGYKRETVKVERLSQQLVLALEAEESFLDEVVVTSYENTTRRNTVGNISSIDMKKIPVQNTSNSLAMLQGLATGLDIQVNGGMLGQASKVRVQGDQSLLFSAPPIYVIDGMVVSEYTTNVTATASIGGTNTISSHLPNAALGGSVSGGNQNARGNFIDFLDFNNIESITVLKDADAVAIYGSRAANGAIVIKTKKATSNGLSLRANTNLQWQPRRLELMNTEEYLQMRQLAIKNSNPPNTNGEAYHDINLYDPNEDNNWQDIVMGHSVMNYQLGFTLSSVQQVSSNRLSFDFKPNNHFYDNGGSHNTFAMSNNYQTEYLNGKLRVNNVTNIGYVKSSQIALDLTDFSLRTAPNFPREIWEAEEVTWEYKGRRLFANAANHPLNRSQHILDYETLTLMNALNLQAELHKSIRFDVNYGMSNSRSEDDYIQRLNDRGQSLYPSTNGIYTSKSSTAWNHNVEGYFTLQDLEVFSGFKLSNITGANYNITSSTAERLEYRGRPLEAFVGNINYYNFNTKNQGLAHYRYFALYNRLSARYRQWMLNVNYRYDGSSRFAPENRWSSFYSVALGWNLSDESWFNAPDLFIKPRVSYGTVGNDNIPDYQYMQRFSFTNSANYPNNSLVRELNLYSKNYKWEDFRKLNAGVDFKYKRLSALVDYSVTTSRDQLIDYQLPPYLGQSGIFQNFPGVFEVRSLEMNLGYDFRLGEQSSLLVNALLTKPKDKLISFPGLEESSYANNLIIGKSKSLNLHPHFLGVDSEFGLYVYQDAANAGQTTTSQFAAKRELVETPVNHYGSLMLTYRIKQFQVSAMLYYRSEKNLQSTLFDLGLYGVAPGGNTNNYRFLLYENFDANPNSDYQKFITTLANVPMGYLNKLNRYFLRINNLSVSYTTDKLIKGKATRLNGYVGNILIATNSATLNYESNSNFMLPQLMNTGLELTINF